MLSVQIQRAPGCSIEFGMADAYFAELALGFLDEIDVRDIKSGAFFERFMSEGVLSGG
jgi:hypothetical protein